MKSSTDTYPCTSVTVLEGLLPIRKRPSMYIGDVGWRGYHRLLYGLIENALREFTKSYASFVKITLHKGLQSATVEDDGYGISIDLHPKLNVSHLEVLMTTLWVGKSQEIPEVGLSTVNALSSTLQVTVCTGGKQYEQNYECGVPKTDLKVIGDVDSAGTKIKFSPDFDIFGEDTRFNVRLIRGFLEMLSVNGKSNFTLIDEENNKEYTWV